jgi:hypothetical protein
MFEGNRVRRGRSFNTQRFSFSETERLKGSIFSRNRFGPTYTATLSELSRGRPFHSLSGDRCDWLQYHFSPAHAAARPYATRHRGTYPDRTSAAYCSHSLEAETNAAGRGRYERLMAISTEISIEKPVAFMTLKDHFSPSSLGDAGSVAHSRIASLVVPSRFC